MQILPLKNSLVAAGLIFLVSSAMAQSQGDTPYDSVTLVFGIAIVEEEDSSRIEEDREPKDVLVEVPQDMIPKRLRNTFEKNDLYTGWEKFPVYQQRNTGLYILNMKEGNTTRTFTFNESGKPVAFSEKTDRD